MCPLLTHWTVGVFKTHTHAHTHLSQERHEGGIWQSFRCIIDSVIYRELLFILLCHTLTLVRYINYQPCVNILFIYFSLCVSTQGSCGYSLGGVLCVFFLFGWRGGGYSRVERHSLCPVFTSLEFKWSAGRLRLSFTSRHLHFPFNTVHSQLLIRPHPSALHTNSHTYITSFHILSFPNTNNHILYCINHSQPFTSADVHMA